MKSFSLLISNGKLSKFGQAVASSGRLLAENMLASECINGYAKLLENILKFPSDTMLPGPIIRLQQSPWEWNLFWKEIEQRTGVLENVDVNSTSVGQSSVVYTLEKNLTNLINSHNIAENETGFQIQDIPTKLDWAMLRDIEESEDFERREMEEVWLNLLGTYCF